MEKIKRGIVLNQFESIDYATEYSDVVDEKITADSITADITNDEFEFTGAKTVKVYNIGTAPMNNYKRTGVNRYGEPTDLEAGTEELTLKQDKSFTFVIDKMDGDETKQALHAGKALARQIRERVVPDIDAYRLSVLALKAGKTGTTKLTKENIYDAITSGSEALDEANVPILGRVIYVTPNAYKLMKQSKEVVLDTEVGQDIRAKGIIAEMDGFYVKKANTKIMPKGIDFIMLHDQTLVSPIKLAEYVIHDNPPGISGQLVEGRIYYDAFVTKNRAVTIYVNKGQEGEA